jgi:hypothetical protein
VNGHVAFGLFLIGLGILSLLDNLGIVNIPSLWRLLWPSLLIWIGYNMLKRQRATTQQNADSALLSLTAILGGADHKGAGKSFAGGSVTAFLGGVALDLREAIMEGEQATLDVFVAMGGIDLTVPRDWTVEGQVTPLLGGFDDKSTPVNPVKRLIVRGTVIMGAVDIKN